MKKSLLFYSAIDLKYYLGIFAQARRLFMPAILTVLVFVGLTACVASRSETKLKTALLLLDVDWHDLSQVVSPGRGGAIESIKGGILGIDLKGRMFYAARNGEVSTVPSSIKTNADAYYSLEEVIEEESKPTRVDRFRVVDILVRQHDSASDVVVSHNYYDVDRRCVSLRVSVLRLENPLKVFSNPPRSSDWKTIFESQPCLALRFDAPQDGPVFMNGHASGGRMAIGEDGSIILSVGDFQNNGVHAPIALAQDNSTPFGKIVRLRGEIGAYEIISKGHRNPQGLVFSSAGTLYATEHGPRGGDELNVIVAGKNYGWPRVTLGTLYGSLRWSLNPHQGRHGTYERPLFAWLPSIAVSSLIETRAFAPEWNGDLLIGTLRDEALWRTRIIDQRVLFTERIPIGSRIRDIVETSNHEVVLWTDDAKLIFLKKIPVANEQQ